MKKNNIMRPAYIILALAVLLCALGVTYASWVEPLTVEERISSGNLGLMFDESRPCSVAVVGADGQAHGSPLGASEISVTSGFDKKQITLTLASGILLDELVAEGKYLMLTYPIAIADGSTVTTISAYADDLLAPSGETAVFTASAPVLRFGESDYALDGLSGLLPELTWQVYRRVEVQEGVITGTILLKLSPESLEALAGSAELTLDARLLPAELEAAAMPLADGADVLLTAAVTASYTASIPLYIEQGR